MLSLFRAFLLFSLLLFVSGPAFADEDCSTLLVENAEGASILIPAAGEKRELQIDDTIAEGDAVATGKEAWVDLRLCDGSGLRVGERSKMTFEEALERNEASFVSWAFDLLKGSLLATVEGDASKERVKMRVRTPTASLGVRGTEFLIDAEDGGDTTVHTLEGEVLLGTREDYAELAKPRFQDFQARFEAVRKEQMSRMAKGLARPLKAAAFQMQKMREQRVAFFRRPIERMREAVVRSKFMEARGRRANPNSMTGGAPPPMPGAAPRQERKEQRQDNRQDRRENRQENKQGYRLERRQDQRQPERRDQKIQLPPGQGNQGGGRMKQPAGPRGGAQGGGPRGGIRPNQGRR